MKTQNVIFLLAFAEIAIVLIITAIKFYAPVIKSSIMLAAGKLRKLGWIDLILWSIPVAVIALFNLFVY